VPTAPAFKNRPAGGATAPSWQADPVDAASARVAQLLRGSAELHGVIILAWDNPAVDQSPPGSDGPPWIRITPSPGESEIYCHDALAGGLVHRTPLLITFEVSVPGTDVKQAQRLWGAIRRAIFPAGGLDEQLAIAGVAGIDLGRPAWGPPRAYQDAKGEPSAWRCEGEGRIALTMYTVTPE
jgi:hypothetical protein